MLKPRFGAPPVEMTLPFLPTIEQDALPTLPTAALTSLTELTLASTDWGKLGVMLMPLMLFCTTERPVM